MRSIRRFPHWLVLCGLLLVLAITFGSGRTQAEISAEPFQKFIASPGTLDTNIDGVTLWHDYGSFALYRVTDNALERLPALVKDGLESAEYMDVLGISARPFNTQKELLDLPDNLTSTEVHGANGSGSGIGIIQFVGPVKADWLAEIEKAGVQPIHYIANNGYLVWTDSVGLNAINDLANAGDFVQFSSPYHPFFKIGPTLIKRVDDAKQADDKVTITVQMYRHDDRAATESLLAGKQVTPWSSLLEYQNANFEVTVADVVEIAQQPDVVWIGEYFERELFDEVQNQIVAGNISGNSPSGTGYLAWLNSFGFSTNPNDYPIVDVVDDGTGTGSVNSGDPTLHEFGSTGNPTRIQYVDNCTNSANGAGPDGHGHINISIVGGYDTRSGFPFRDPNGYQRGLGVNPYARIASTRIFDPGFDLSRCSNSDTGLIKSSQDSGADITTNSWGCGGCAGSYDTSSQAFDVGVRDADLTQAGNQEMIMFFAAGNDGPSSASIGSPGNGKNMITVGASENVRPNDEDGSWTDGCGINAGGANSLNDVIGFSSRGPAPGGRVKPEIIAPGTHIQGTASTNGSYNGSGVCDQYRPSGQTTFASSSGTSHSTPAAAGVGSLYYYHLENSYSLTPSPAMMKSYMIAHPTYLTGVSANDTLPSNSQGFGMPDMGTAFDNTARLLVDQTTTFDNSGETWTWSGSVADTGEPVRIVLSWTDAAGATGTNPEVNNLNLTATINGSLYRGNVFSGQWSTTGGSFDNNNNYEAIFLPAGTSGTVEITVTAFNIGGNGVPNSGDNTDQDFALVCYNCAQQPDFTIDVTPDTVDVCAPANGVYNVALGSLLGFNSAVTLSASGVPAGATSSFSPNPVTPAGNSTLTIGNTGAVAAGSYNITVTGTGGGETHDDSVVLNVTAGVPGAPTLVAPADGATGVSAEPTLSWNAVASASGYLVEVATDAAFATVVYSANETGTSHTIPTASALAFNTQHYWRVTATNGCGSGSASAARSFTTTALPSEFCSTSALAIPDGNSSGVNQSITVPASGTISDLNVSLDVTHTWVGDLTFTLSHNGTVVAVFDRPGVPGSTYGCSGNNILAELDDEAAASVESQCAAATPTINGTFQPNNALSAFDGLDVNGTWTINAADNVGQDSGTLNEWCILPTVQTAPTPTPVTPTATPVTPTATPVTPTATPVTPTATPVTPTATPVTPTATPVTPTATPVTPTPTPTPPPAGGDVVYVGSTSAGNAGGVQFQDEDILSYDTDTGTWAMYLDGSDVGLNGSGARDINAFTILDDGSILLSIAGASTLPDVGAVDDSDLVRFIPTSLGTTTAGTFEMYFDGSDVNLTTNGEDIDAVTVLDNGDIVFSTLGNFNVVTFRGGDEDMIRFTPTTLGANTTGTMVRYFDGSDVGLADSGDEDVYGVWVDEASGDVYLTTRLSFSVPGVSGQSEDIIACTPGSLGNATTCTWAMYFDGSVEGYGGELMDSMHIERAAPATASIPTAVGLNTLNTQTSTLLWLTPVLLLSLLSMVILHRRRRHD